MLTPAYTRYRRPHDFGFYAFGERGEVLGEVNEANGFDLKWSLHVANQKAAWYTFMGNSNFPTNPFF